MNDWWEAVKESFQAWKEDWCSFWAVIGWPVEEEEPEADPRIVAIIERVGGGVPTIGAVWIGKEYQINDLLRELKDIRDNP
jgi:hypothetical protein